MALFEKTLQGVANLDSIMTAAHETFRKEKKRILETYKDPAEKIGAIKKVLEATDAEQKQIFRKIVKEEFADVRQKVNEVVTAAPPADFHATLEAVRATGDGITEYEATALLAKYKGENYLAFRTVAEILHRAGRAKDVRLVYPDAIMNEIDSGEKFVLDWANGYTGAPSYLTGLLQHHNNPITALAAEVQDFLDGKFELTDK